MLRQWTSSSSSSQLSLIIFSVVVWVAGTSSVQHDVNNDDSTASSSTTLPLHDSPASADDPVQSSPLQSLIVLPGPSESPETIQNPLNPSEELLDPLESKVSTENPLRTAINASLESSASLQVIQDPSPSSEVAEDPSEAKDVLRDLRGTKRGSRDPSGSLGGPENPRETPETLLDVPLTQVAPTSAKQPDDDPPPPPGSSHFIREARQTTRSLSDVLRSSEGVQDDQGFPHPTKESPGGPEVSLGTPSLKDDGPETQPDSPEPSHARRDEAKLSLWEIISSSGLADDVTKSSKSHPDDVELAESISEAFNSSEDMREEFKPVDSIQDVLKALESIKHNLRSAESIQDALSIPGAIQKRLRSSSGTSPAALTKSASIRISHNQPPRGSIMLQDAERHAIIDADLLRALSLEVKDELRARTAESDGPAFRRFTGIGRPRALLPPGQKRRRRISRRYNRTRPLASSNPNVYAREGGSMTFDARRRYRKRPADDNSEDKVTPRDYEATQEVVEPVTLLDPTTSARAGYKPDLTMRKYTTDVEDMREAVGLNSYEIRKEERGEESTDPQAGGSSVGDFESRSKTRDYVPRTTSRPGDHNRDESRIHMPENQENTAVYDVEAEQNSRYTLPSRQEAHLPGHPTPPGGHGEHEVPSGGRGLRRDESQASSDYPQATHTITQPPGSHPMTVPEAPSFYISPTPPVVRSIPRPSPNVILNHPPGQLLTRRPPQTSATHYDRSPDPVPDPGNIYATKQAATQDTDQLGYSTRNPSFLNSITQEHPRTPWPRRQGSPTRASTPTAGRTTSPSTPVQGMVPISYDPEAVIREIIGFHGHGHHFLPSYPPVIRSFSPQRFTPPLPVTPPPLRPYTRVVWRVTPSAAPSPHPHPNPPPRYTHTAHLQPGSQSSSDLPPGIGLPPSSHILSPGPTPPPRPPTPPHQPSLGSGGPRHPPQPTNQAGPDHTRAKASPPTLVVPPMAVGPRSSQPPRPSPGLPIPRYTDTRPIRGHTTTKRAHAAPTLPHATVRSTYYTPSGTESLPSNPTYSPPELIFMPSEPLPTTPRPVYLTSHPEFEPRTVYKTREHSDRRQIPVNTNASPTKVTRRIPAKPVQEYPTYGAVPPTSFTCDDKLTGYYADPEAYCQVFHMCHYEGQQHSFLCPNGTLFNQQLLTCDHWRNVNCHKATSHYVVNKKLYRLQKKDQYSNKSKRQTSQIRQDQANTVTPSSYWRPEMMSFPYRPIIDSYVTIPSPHSTSSRVNSPYSAPITDSYVTTPSLHTVSSLANTPYGTPTKVSYVTAPQSYKAVVALG